MNLKKTLSVLVKPSSSLCNLHCRYCFYTDESKNREVPSHGLMNKNTMVKLIERIGEYVSYNGIVNISFQGGEPLLSGFDYFHDFVSEMGKYPQIETHYTIQTNGTLIDEEFARFFRENNFLVGVSLDGYEENMNYYRIAPHIANVHSKVLENIEILKQHEVDFNILTVITRKLAEHPEELFSFFLSQEFEYIQLIPCLPAFGEKKDEISLTPNLYAHFFKSLFNSWKRAYCGGHYIKVNLFENILSILLEGHPYQCGMLGICSSQQVIESNGDVYPCDFYCLDNYRMGNIHEKSFNELSKSDGIRLLMENMTCEKEVCKTCPYRNICHGGCQRQNVCYLQNEYCAYKEVLGKVLPELIEMANMQS